MQAFFYDNYVFDRKQKRCIIPSTKTEQPKAQRMNVQNRTIFSNDNLPVLRGMDTESVDLIYLDPPFNSNRNYAAPKIKILLKVSIIFFLIEPYFLEKYQPNLFFCKICHILTKLLYNLKKHFINTCNL